MYGSMHGSARCTTQLRLEFNLGWTWNEPGPATSVRSVQLYISMQWVVDKSFKSSRSSQLNQITLTRFVPHQL